MARIIIKNFGPIVYIDFNLDKSFNVVIGEQASGKSTLAKCIFFFKDVISDFENVLLRQPSKNRKKTPEELLDIFYIAARKTFTLSFGKNVMRKNSELHYYYGNGREASIEYKKGEVNFRYNEKAEKDIIDIVKKYLKILSKNDRFEESFHQLHAYAYMMDGLFGERHKRLFIPACRSRVTDVHDMGFIGTEPRLRTSDVYLNNMLAYISYFKFFIDSINEEDAEIYYRLNENSPKDLHGMFSKFKQLKETILKGKYRWNREKNETYIEIDGKEQIPIKFGSSGQQESLWILNFLTMIMMEARETFVIIEEPEAHLYPNAQLELVKLISLVVNMTGSDILVTTHSPYILSSFNLLTYSGKIEGEEFKGIVDKEYRINPNKMGAYKLENGGCRDIFDYEESMIVSDEIDGVSACINNTFNELLMKSFGQGDMSYGNDL